jgi:large subunit ribosomal protein L29
MKPQEFRALTAEELGQRIDELSRELFNLRFQAKTRQLADMSRMRQVRRDVARAKTILQEIQSKAEVQ